MTVLLDTAQLDARRPVADGPLRILADSLRADLEPLLASPEPWIPREKARMTRSGGRCPVDGVLLEFDPASPHDHRCRVCGRSFRDDSHYRWWVMSYQLWLAERSLQAAALYAVRGDVACGALARTILSRYADVYLDYPNLDNVLGPTRPFFSTYLESIWTLQLTVALDLLERRDGASALGGRVRERILQPSAVLIASFDEGLSNRQVWHNAALVALGDVLGDATLADRAIHGPSGLASHLRRGLLADGTWYEGENYHLFAHRGLWMAAAVAEAGGWVGCAEGRRRLADGFAAPFATALPDFTFPARRDSQYGVSLRQWRIAESCELGMARGDDARLRAALAELYRDDVAPGDTGRARSTAEAERNQPAVRLTRASLGWKSLLFAAPGLPPLEGRLPASVHLAGQGIAVIRRDAARVYVALDYGASGGGHGHPDRLNLWLVAGEARFLEDVGTGSYVDRSLHWYRSTLAHNAPLVDGRSQRAVDGSLVAWDERGGAGWIAAEAAVAPGVVVRRTVVVMPNYLVDAVEWRADRDITFDFPWHVDADLADGHSWTPGVLAGGSGVEDGFGFVTSAEYAPGAGVTRLSASRNWARLEGWVSAGVPCEWWRCVAPGPPGAPERRFLLQRTRGREGRSRSVWSWTPEILDVVPDGDRIVVHLRGEERHEHSLAGGQWHIDLFAGGARSSIDLLGASNAERGDAMQTADRAEQPSATGTDPASDASRTFPVACLSSSGRTIGALTVDAVDAEVAGTSRQLQHERPRAVSFRLGESHYRRSELTWKQAGAPEALVAVAATSHRILVEVSVRKRDLVFRPDGGVNELDNEHPDVNSDGVQLYVGAADGGRRYAWLLVPVTSSQAVRVTPSTASGPPMIPEASWRQTTNGYVIRCEVPRAVTGPDGADDFRLDVVVNEIARGRERRQGQLVLSGAQCEWVYLRGDRHDASRALRFRIVE